MKTEKNILLAFLLNLFFSIFEFFGGIFTGSVAIISDSIHDIGDAMSIGISYFLEKKSKKKPDDKYTYGYTRYSVLGAIITTVILLVGSILVLVNSIDRIFNPVDINYQGMIIFAIIGFIVNLLASLLTKHGHSMNEKAVNLHMLEDVLGWLLVLIGSIIMNFTDIKIIDPILSILLALFILISSLKNLKKVIDLFLEKTPNNISIEELRKYILTISDIKDIHHIHVWSIDGYHNYATMHIITNKDNSIKKEIREKLKEYDIIHITIEIEKENEGCDDLECHTIESHHHHHH